MVSKLIPLLVVAFVGAIYFDVFPQFRDFPLNATASDILTFLVRCIWTVVTWTAASFGLLYAFAATSIYRASKKLLGSIPKQVRRHTWKLAFISNSNANIESYTALLYITIISSIAYFAFRDWHILFITFFSASLRTWLYIRISTPPTVVFLGVSSLHSIDQQRRLKYALAPLRVVSLLSEGESFQVRKHPLHLDLLRTSNDADWWPVIQDLLDNAPFILINMTLSSEYLQNELKYIFEQSMLYKCIFMIPSGVWIRSSDAMPMQQMIDWLQYSRLCVLSERDSLDLIKSRASKGMLPTAEVPIYGCLEG